MYRYTANHERAQLESLHRKSHNGAELLWFYRELKELPFSTLILKSVIKKSFIEIKKKQKGKELIFYSNPLSNEISLFS